MAWNIAVDNHLVLDLSVYQRDPATHKPPDLAEVKRLNPSIEGVYVRMALWDDTTPDYDFEANYDSAGAAGYPEAVYSVVRCDRDPKRQVDNWVRILGPRRPKAILLDGERDDGQTASRQLTVQGQTLAYARQAFPFANVIDFYTANWYWRKIGQAAWQDPLMPILAQYPYANALLKRQYESIDDFLARFPFGTTSMPTLPPGFKVAGGWQFSSQLIVPGIANSAGSPRTDGNLWTDALWTKMIGAGQAPPPPPPGARPKVEVTVKFDPTEVDLTMAQETN